MTGEHPELVKENLLHNEVAYSDIQIASVLWLTGHTVRKFFLMFTLELLVLIHWLWSCGLGQYREAYSLFEDWFPLVIFFVG